MKRDYVSGKACGSWIDPDKLKAETSRVGLNEKALLDNMCGMLVKSVGVKWKARWPSKGVNNPFCLPEATSCSSVVRALVC